MLPPRTTTTATRWLRRRSCTKNHTRTVHPFSWSSSRSSTASLSSFTSSHPPNPLNNNNKNKTNHHRFQNFHETKHGFGTIQARCNENSTTKKTTTQLTHISHQAPARCIPLQHRSVQANGAICVLSNYGGGLVQGDRVDWNIHVQKGAQLGLTTQGANRIYKHLPHSASFLDKSQQEQQLQQHPISQTALHAIVEPNALLVHAPDPVSCFQHSRYRQTSHIQVQHADTDDHTYNSSGSQTSVCWMDWFSAGRISRGERWQQTQLENYTTFQVLGRGKDNDSPVVCHDNTILHSPHMGPFSAFGTLLLYGPQVQDVVQQCLSLQSQLVRQYTRVRQHPLLLRDVSKKEQDRLLPFLAGRCVVGVSQVNESLYMARFLTQSNEDMYRLLHQCLLPLQSHFEYAFYQDRLQSQHSAAVPESGAWRVNDDYESFSSTTTTTSTTTMTERFCSMTPQSQWLSYLLSDSSLPVGGFAHSAGLEAAHQLGLVPNVESLEAYIHAVVHSTLQLVVPLVRASHAWVRGPTRDDWTVYRELQELAHSHLCTNEMSCRVSLDQGRSLLRVFHSWNDPKVEEEQEEKGQSSDRMGATSFSRIRRMYTEISANHTTATNTRNHRHHLAPIWGTLTALFGLSEDEACQLLGYCVARDVVSAAVRMNLLGPMQSTELLARTQRAVQAGMSSTTTPLAGCAPLVDAIHPCHNVLSTRLFRS